MRAILVAASAINLCGQSADLVEKDAMLEELEPDQLLLSLFQAEEAAVERTNDPSRCGPIDAREQGLDKVVGGERVENQQD